MKAVICVGLLLVAFAFGLRAEPVATRLAAEAEKVLGAEDRLRSAGIEIQRLLETLAESQATAASLQTQAMRVPALESALREAEAQAARLREENGALMAELSQLRNELAVIKTTVQRAAAELAPAPTVAGE